MPAFSLLHCLRGLLPLLLLCLWSAAAGWAQPAPITFGVVDSRDLTAAPFVGDSAAAAVVLCDFGRASIVTEGEMRVDRIMRLKILKKEGMRWGDVEVRLHHDVPGYSERLTDIRGCTYNLVNGQVVPTPLAPANIFGEEKSEQYSLRKFALPNVREGSVIEFSYTLYSNYLANFRTWEFQQPIPVRWSEYRATIPHQFNYKIFTQAKQPLAVDEQTAPNSLQPTHRWAMRNVPALRTEPFMTTTADYVDKVFFELANYAGQDVTRSWEQIDRFILHEWALGQQLDNGNFLKAGLARLPPPTAGNAAQRLAAVRALVCGAVRCTGELSMRIPASLRTIYQQTHQGSTAEVNFLLILALRGAGFAANPILLSTRAHGRVRATMPALWQFNYVAAHVRLPDGQELVLDATDPLLPYDMLPEHCLNQQGRLVMPTPGASRWVELKPRYRRSHLQRVQLQVAPDGSLSGQVHEEFAGYLGARQRRELSAAGDKQYTASLSRSMPGWTITALVVSNRDSVQQPLALDYAVALPASAAQVDVLALNLCQDFDFPDNPFQTETRQYPVDFAYPREETLLLGLSLPAGYALAETPKSRALDLPDNGGRYMCSTTATGPTVQFTSRLSLRKPVYAVAEYGPLRELFRLMMVKQAEKLIIQKKAG